MNITAIILAAGRGSRMGALTKETPKPLIVVGGKPLIEHMISFVKKVGADSIFIAGGTHFEKLKNEVGEIDQNVQLVKISDGDLSNQNLVSLDAVLKNISDQNLLVCNADYIFKNETVKSVSKSLKEISVYCSFDLSADDDDVMKVRVDENKNLVAMSKTLDTFDAVYTGIFYIAEKEVSLIRTHIQNIFKKYTKEEATVEYIFNELVKEGHAVYVQDVGVANWFEFDTPEDLEKGRRALG